MKKIALLLLFPVIVLAQEKPAAVAPKQTGKYDTNKFSQMYDLLATPNMYRSASGAPGPAYYQQQADYKINIELDDISIVASEAASAEGSATLTLDDFEVGSVARVAIAGALEVTLANLIIIAGARALTRGVIYRVSDVDKSIVRHSDVDKIVVRQSGYA